MVDPKTLLTKQYDNPCNLNKRLSLHEQFSTNKYGWPRWVFDQLQVPANGEVLDLGCGPAFLWTRNADRIPQDWIITLSDMSAGMVEQAQKNVAEIAGSFLFRQMDAQSIEMEDQSVDVVIANHVLYHISVRSKVYSDIFRILRPGGYLYAATNGKTAEGIPALVNRVKPDTYDDTLSFSLENGAAELSSRFREVELLNYEDSLRITDVEPLIDYVESTQRLNEAELARFRVLANEEMSRHSEIHLEKSVGMFRTKRPI